MAAWQPLTGVQLKVISPSAVRPPLPTRESQFWDCCSKAELCEIQRQISRLPDEAVMPCRGRNGPHLEWDYGFATKKDRGFIHFVYGSGDRETLPIRGISFGKLVQLEIIAKRPTARKLTLILAHGLSPEVGPHYPLIQRFHESARK